jgi:hypothetical protein
MALCNISKAWTPYQTIELPAGALLYGPKVLAKRGFGISRHDSSRSGEKRNDELEKTFRFLVSAI